MLFNSSFEMLTLLYFASRIRPQCYMLHVLKSEIFIQGTEEGRGRPPLSEFSVSTPAAVLLYGCETWSMTKRDEAKLDTLLHKCLRNLLKNYWPMKVPNEEVRRRNRTCTISELIKRRRWRWIEHVLRMNNQQNPRIALTWAPEGKKSRLRPKVTWSRTVEGERQKMGFATWSEAVTAARDRAGWRRQVNGPILLEETLKISQIRQVSHIKADKKIPFESFLT